MIKFYVNQIKRGIMTLEQVPEKWREAVEQALQGEDVEPVIVDTSIPQKAEAYDYLTGRSNGNE